MNLILLREGERAHGDTFRIDGDRAAHVSKVLRAKEGDSLVVGLLDGPLGKGRVMAITEGSVTLACTFDATVRPRASFDVALAVPRPKMLRRILFAAAEIGVDRLVLFRTWRVEQAYLSSPALEPDACLPHLVQGLMQGRSTRLPLVTFVPTFRAFLDEALPSLKVPRFVLHPTDAPLLRSDGEGHGTLVLGPEGGFIPREVESLNARGCLPRTLGPRILRVETAFVYALAALGSVEHQSAR
ncbi:MAG: RsmE family RNA methyltransferase [Polyangiaceae bacterium]